MILTRVETRCDHGFLDGKNCQVCALTPEPRPPNDSVLVPGILVGGSTILRRLGDSNVEMRCGCGEVFVTTRSALWKARNRGTRSCCAACRRSARGKAKGMPVVAKRKPRPGRSHHWARRIGEGVAGDDVAALGKTERE